MALDIAVEDDMIATVNLAQKLSLFADFWHPRIVGELNDSYIKLVKGTTLIVQLPLASCSMLATPE